MEPAWRMLVTAVLMGSPLSAGFADGVDAPAGSAATSGESGHTRSPSVESTSEPDLDTILLGWQRASARRYRFDAEFRFARYDHIFEVESWGKGSLAVDSRGRLAYRIVPDTPGRTDISTLCGPNGNRYLLRSADFQRWHWTDSRVFSVDERTARYELLGTIERGHPNRPAPPSLPESPPFVEDGDLDEAPVVRTAATTRSCGPQRLGNALCEAVAAALLAAGFRDAHSVSVDVFAQLIRTPYIYESLLIGLPPCELKRRFEITKMESRGSNYCLCFVPRLKEGQQQFSKALLLLSPDRFEPVALKLVDSNSGDKPAESVYTFSNVRFTDLHADGEADLERLDRLDLRGLRRVRR